MKRVALVLFAVACADPLPSPSPPPAPSASPSSSLGTPSPLNVDARIRFEEGPDPDYGENATSVRAFLEVPVLHLEKKLFTVPFPYACGRDAGDAGEDLVVRCTGDDGMATATLRATPTTLVVLARDYGRIALDQTRDEIPLPPGATATVFAPARYPNTTHRNGL